MAARIREFREGDYDAFAALHNAVYPDYKCTASDWRHWDERRGDKIRWRRWLVEADGEVVAWGSYTNNPYSFHPRKFSLELGVHPEHRRRGIGGRLYDHMIAALSELDPIVLRADIREDKLADRCFAEARGFTERMRTEESRLDIRAFDPERFRDDVLRVERQGIVIKAYPDLADQSQRDRMLHDLDREVMKDVPSPDPVTPLDFDAWRKLVLESPRFLPACNLIALDGASYVGLSNLWREATPGRLETGLTGVRRAYRRRGIATALKVKALARAKEMGYDTTITWNEERNKGMLGINLRLGFKLHPAWLQMEKVLDAEALAKTMEPR